ncbi:unnamed protein product [Ilex paraguariensis]|uniref:Bifunctional inhibitor/plant lipid transfer protein/seed storage helical domain-containing protein n=1 Tax=Ilex paraguariensis TaxID=185542 RepID=A0ABC8SD94_9AQUA
MSKIVGFVMIFYAVFGSSMAHFFGGFGGLGGWGGGGYGGFDCVDISSRFAWCKGFIEGTDSYASPQCCENLQQLNAIAEMDQTGPSRICQCVKEMGNSGFHPSYSQSRIQDVINTCGVPNFPISNNVDCSRQLLNTQFLWLVAGFIHRSTRAGVYVIQKFDVQVGSKVVHGEAITSSNSSD